MNLNIQSAGDIFPVGCAFDESNVHYQVLN
jgi:hypothetical protein